MIQLLTAHWRTLGPGPQRVGLDGGQELSDRLDLIRLQHEPPVRMPHQGLEPLQDDLAIEDKRKWCDLDARMPVASGAGIGFVFAYGQMTLAELEAVASANPPDSDDC